MCSSIKYILHIIWKNRAVTILISFVVAITIVYTISASGIYLPSDRSLYTTPDFCQVTSDISTIRQLNNTIKLDPDKNLIEELLEIVTFNPDICREELNDERFLLVAIVDSARGNFKERQVIRSTWGSVRTYKNWKIKTAFLVGQSSYCLTEGDASRLGKNSRERASEEEESLMEEQQKFGDIVLGSFVDTYRNLTYKHLMGYSFVVKHCPDVDFIVKTDDDMFVDLPGILDMRTTEFETHGNGTDGRQTSGLFDIYCHNYYLDKPSRDPSDKWFSTREEWPEDTYPTYCLGNDYAISMEYLKKIYSVRHLGGFFWVDDVFIMGKLREIVEKTYNKSTNMLNMRAFGKTTDPRSEPSYIKDNCDSFRFGWFVFLDRSSEHFLLSMECLWRKVKTNMYINQALIVSMSMP